MTKYLITFCFSILFIQASIYGQSDIIVDLTTVTKSITTKGIYVRYVEDDRVKKEDLGKVISPDNQTEYNVLFKNKLSYDVYTFYKKNVAKIDGSTPLIISFDQFHIAQRMEDDRIKNVVTLSAEFREGKVKAGEEIVERTFDFSTDSLVIADQLANSLEQLIEQFNQSEWKDFNIEVKEEILKEEILKEEILKGKDVKSENKERRYESSYFNLGYQIGGYNLIGVDYEARTSKYGSIHIGVGVVGYTAGFKIYPIIGNSLNLNFSYKNGGFGLISTIGVEIGGRIWFNNKTSLIGQLGVASIRSIDNSFAAQLGIETSQKGFLTLGVGVSRSVNKKY